MFRISFFIIAISFGSSYSTLGLVATPLGALWHYKIATLVFMFLIHFIKLPPLLLYDISPVGLVATPLGAIWHYWHAYIDMSQPPLACISNNLLLRTAWPLVLATKKNGSGRLYYFVVIQYIIQYIDRKFDPWTVLATSHFSSDWCYTLKSLIIT